MKRLATLLALYLIIYIGAAAQTDSIDSEASVREVTVTSKNSMRRIGGAVNGVSIGRQELFKAACCNLGESFTTNPSVDVSYSDAATGAKQIKLLGLSGTYVQMLTEQMPTLRSAALPYALDYVPGPWMQSIQVSKGASTVKNGYESVTGQIDVEYLKPNDVQHLGANVYGDSKGRLEANFDGNLHLSDRLSTLLLLHGENAFAHHDDNHDTFLDMPRRRQYHLANRWKLVADRYIMHAGLSLLNDYRRGGQDRHTMDGEHDHLTTFDDMPGIMPADMPYYEITTEARRYEAYMKHAFILNPEHQTNIALMANGALHQHDATYGLKTFGNNEKTLDAQLMLETNLTDHHQLSVGTSLSHYYSNQQLAQMFRLTNTYHFWTNAEQSVAQRINEHETTTGLYAQYTLNTSRFTAIAGLRADYSDAYHWFVTPRLHLKFTPSELLTLRASVGRGYRSPHFYAENHYLLASGRQLIMSEPLRQEKAWNMGASMAWNIPVGRKTLQLNAEYYYTTFQQQTVVNYTTVPVSFPCFDINPQIDLQSYYSIPGIVVGNLHGRSYSHTVQVDATYPLFEGMTATAAWRWNDVKCAYHNYFSGADELLQRPLTSRYKALLSLSYAPGLALWHFDATLQLNGGGRIVGQECFHAYEQLQAQVTRDFRHLSLYVGGENLTNRRQHNPVRSGDNPWTDAFDATLVWGPVHGPLFYFGIRFNIEKI